MKSLSRRLLWLLLGALTVAALCAGVSSYLKAHEEIDELFDYQLLQLALSHKDQTSFENRTTAASDYEKDEGVTVQIWDTSGSLMYASRPGELLSRAPSSGLQTISARGAQWRVYLLAHQGRIIQVAQSFQARREISFDLALRTIIPLCIIFSLLALTIWLVVRYTLKPLTEVANGVARLSPTSLEPLPEHELPDEILPLVQRLNYLFKQLGHAFDLQKRFVADAAHELRTPLSAVKLQVRILERSSCEEERAAALGDLRSGVDRAARLVGQLLALARVEPEAPHVPPVDVSLNGLVSEIFAEQSWIASDKGITLEAKDTEPVQISGEPDALRAMISNLVDNAIRYTPSGGAVTVTLRADEQAAIIEIADSGSGIPPSERERIFDRFYRGQRKGGSGCGLGLAIVKSAVTRHGGSITLGEATAGKGLRVTIMLPRESAVERASGG